MRGFFRIIFKDLRSTRTKGFLYLFSFFLFTALAIMLLDISGSILTRSAESRKQIYGSYSYIYYDQYLLYISNEESGRFTVYTRTSSDEQSLYVGFADEAAIELGSLNLLKGSWPSSKSDAVITESVSEDMGISVGDTLEIDGYSYEISGMIEDYGRLWPSGETQTNNDLKLPNILISEERANALSALYQIVLLDTDDELSEATDLIGTDLYYNVNATDADEDLFELPAFFYIIFIIFAFLISGNVILLLGEQWKSRLNTFYLLGMPRRSVAALAGCEIFIYGILGNALGTVCGHYFAKGLLSLLGKASDISIAFNPDVKTELSVFIFMTLLCLISIVVFLIIFFRNRNVKRLVLKSGKTAKGSFLRRAFLEYGRSKKTVLLALSLLGIISISLLAGILSYQEYYKRATEYVETDGKMPFNYDIELRTLLRDSVNQAVSSDENVYESSDEDLIFYSDSFSSDGADSSLKQALLNENGIDSVLGYKEYLNSYILIEKGCLDNYLDGSDGLLDGGYIGNNTLDPEILEAYDYTEYLMADIRIMGYEDEDLEWLSAYISEGEPDLDKLKSGEEVILMVPTYTLEATGQGAMHTHVSADTEGAIADTNFHVGDTITLSTLVSDSSFNGYLSLEETTENFQRQDTEVKIGAIIRVYAGWFENSVSPETPYTVLTSNTAFGIICPDTTYSHLRIYLDSSANIDETVAVIREYLKDYPYVYMDDHISELNSYRQYNIVLKLFTAVLIAFGIFTCLLIAYSQFLIKTKLNVRLYVLYQLCGDSRLKIYLMLLLRCF